MDEDGYCWILDRKKDMFISGGENVYPAEIEGVLSDYPGIAECAVVGVADPQWGEVGHLAIVPASQGAVDADAVLAFLREKLARYKVPKHVSVVDTCRAPRPESCKRRVCGRRCPDRSSKRKRAAVPMHCRPFSAFCRSVRQRASGTRRVLRNSSKVSPRKIA